MRPVFRLILVIAATIPPIAYVAVANAVMQEAGVRTVDHQRIDHSARNDVLKKHVDADGLVDYESIGQSRLFNDYLEFLANTSADSLLDNQDRLAFWINAYNALTIQSVLQTLPTDPSAWPNYRITEQTIKGESIWKGIRFNVGGGHWTLDDIEHEIPRKRDGLRDPRIHVALVCVARGCPALWNRAYTGGAIEEQLSAAMRRFVINSKQCRIDVGRREIRISKVFEWYGADFVDEKFSPRAESIPAFLAPYVTDPAVREALLTVRWSVTYFDYDWRLNIQP